MAGHNMSTHTKTAIHLTAIPPLKWIILHMKQYHAL